MARVDIYTTKANAYSLRHGVQRVVRLCNRVEREAKRRVAARSYDTGRLHRSIRTVVKVRGQKVKGKVGSDVAYARPIHDGSKPHTIVARRAGGLKFFWPAGVGNPPLAVGRVVCFKGRVHHPGHGSNRFLMIPLRQEAPKLGFRVVGSHTASRFTR